MNLTFLHLFSIARKIEFNPQWIERVRYFTYAVKGIHAPVLKPGEFVSTVDNYSRKILIIGINGIDNIVVFQRYFNNSDVSIIVSNETFDFYRLVKDETGVDISNVITEVEMNAICKTISKNTVKPKFNWFKKATFLKQGVWF